MMLPIAVWMGLCGGCFKDEAALTGGSVDFSPQSAGSAMRLRAVWGASTSEVYAVGDGGVILQRLNRGDWVSLPSGVTSPLQSVAGSAGRVYVVGDGGVVLRGAQGTFTLHDAHTMAGLRGVFAVDGEVIAVGAKGTIVRSVDGGETWTAVPPPPMAGDLHAVWGPNAAELYAVGAAGVILHSLDGGTSWTPQMTGPQMTGPPSDLRGIVGGAQGVLVIGGAGQVLLAPDGKTWSPVMAPPQVDFQALASDGRGGFWLSGNMGRILHFDASGWKPSSSNTTRNLTGIWAGSPSELYAVGDMGTVLYARP